jgi:hypothetical protein
MKTDIFPDELSLFLRTFSLTLDTMPQSAGWRLAMVGDALQAAKLNGTPTFRFLDT